jgi:hypothetical protein
MRRTALLVAAAMLGAVVTRAEVPPTGAEIVERSQLAFYYPGADMRSKVTMELVTAEGMTRSRVLTMLRKNDPAGRDQKYFLYFHEPGDVRRTAFLVWKYPGRDSDRWIFIPAVNMVRRIAARDSRSSFVGSDFTYEDVSGRNVAADRHTLVREEKLGEHDCYVVESVPQTETDYTRKLSWIDRETFLPLKEEYYDERNELARVFTADRIEEIPAGAGSSRKTYPTITKRTMKNVKSGHKTEVTYGSVAYDLGLDDDVFAERALQTPPLKWMQ